MSDHSNGRPIEQSVGSAAAPIERPLLVVRGVAKAYGPVVALRSVDMTVGAGEVHALLGANGAGKSTLVKILSGVIALDKGSVEIEGRAVSITTPADARAHRVATVFQDPALIGDLTVADNLKLTKTPQKRFLDWVESMELAGLDLDDLVRELPLPMLRMLDLARALADDPLLLLLDEITAALPVDLAERVFRVMSRWRQEGRAVLFISHRLAEVLAHCDETTVLRDGRNVAAFAPGEGGERRLVRAMLGEAATAEPAQVAGAHETNAGDVALETRGVRVGRRLQELSLAVRGGEILGVTGLEGQGQELLFEVLAGERRPDAGDLIVKGHAVTARSPYDLIRRGVVLVPADRRHALLPKRAVAENLTLPLFNRPGRWRLFDRADARTRIAETIDRLSIDTRAQSQARRLSGGNQQKVAIGRWLTSGFTTLLCFDPTRGIDIGTKQQIYELLRGLAAEGVAVILYTSELREVQLVCDRVLVMYGGRIVHEQDARGADEARLLTAAHGLEQEEPAV
jgi:ribose transport system ATP-binding protein